MTDDPAPSIQVLLVDDHPIVRDGIRSLMLRRRDIRIVGEAQDGDEAMRIGAAGYPVKNCSSEDLVRAIRRVHQGELFFPQDVSTGEENNWTSSVPPVDNELSERELEVIGLIAAGLTNKRIADELGLGVRTVETHRENIMNKLKIRSVAGLTRYAIARGLRVD